jgi:hypothetical protein
MKTIYVDSKDRLPGGSPCSFTIQLPSTLDLTGKRMRVDLMRMPISVPTIQSGKNDTLIVRLGSQDYTITLSQGQFTGPELASHIQSLLIATAPGSWACIYDASNIAMSLTCSNNFSLVGGTFGEQLLSRAYTQQPNSYRFSYVPVTGEDVVFLCSPNFSTLDNVGPNNSHDVILPCVITAPFGSVQDFSMPADVWHSCPGGAVQQLSFELRDRKFNLMSAFIPNISFLVTVA